MKTPLQHFSTRRLGVWQGEWEFLQRSLAHEPDAVQAWWWKLRLRVLTSVIRRYGADPVVRARDYAPEPLEAGGDLMFGERRTVEPRPCAALGAHLQSIVKENDFPRPPALPDEGDHLRLPPLPDDHPSGSNFGIRFFHVIVVGVSLVVIVNWIISVGPGPFVLWFSDSIHHWLMKQ